MVGESLDFDVSQSSDPGGNIVKYERDFGDDQTAQGIKVAHLC